VKTGFEEMALSLLITSKVVTSFLYCINTLIYKIMIMGNQEGNRSRHSKTNTDRNTNDPNVNLTEEERKAKAAREAANRDADNESPNHREAALNRKRNTLNDQNANSNQQETYRQSV
jgi:hypothetical protein